jgi:acetyltransferase-like isoleucine patch superfamily enzyme
MVRMRDLREVRELARHAKWLYYTRVWGMDIHPSAEFSQSTHFDKTNPRGVHIGAETYLTLGVVILAHDYTKGLHTDTWVGKHCFVGARSVIMPGVRVADCSIVGAGSVVVKDVPSRCIVAGNPARVIRDNVEVGPYGRDMATIGAAHLDYFWKDLARRRERLRRRYPSIEL